MPFYNVHVFTILPLNIYVKRNNFGTIDLLIQNRRGYSTLLPKLQLFDITIPEARQAKCTQSWLDKVKNPNDRYESISTYKINIIKKMHDVLNSLKLLKCIKCCRQTPGFDKKIR